MQKHDKMVALAKEKSAEMTETAITAIESMYRKNEKSFCCGAYKANRTFQRVFL